MKKPLLYLSLVLMVVLSGFNARPDKGHMKRLANNKMKMSATGKAMFNIGLLAEGDDWSDCVQRDYSLWGGEPGDVYEWYIDWSYANHPGWGRQFICNGEEMTGWKLDAGDVVTVKVISSDSDPDYEVWEGITECED